MIAGILVGLVLAIVGVVALLAAMLLLARGNAVLKTIAQENEKLVVSVADLKAQIDQKDIEIEKLAKYVGMANSVIQEYKLQSANLNVLLAKQHEAIVQNEALSGFLTSDPAVQEILNRKLKVFIKH